MWRVLSYRHNPVNFSPEGFLVNLLHWLIIWFGSFVYYPFNFDIWHPKSSIDNIPLSTVMWDQKIQLDSKFFNLSWPVLWIFTCESFWQISFNSETGVFWILLLAYAVLFNAASAALSLALFLLVPQPV